CFYQRSQQTCFSHHVEAAARAYAGPRAKYQTDFWRRRSSVAAEDHVPRHAGSSLSALTPNTRLCISPQTQIAFTPTIDGTIIRQTEAVVLPSLSEPVAYLGVFHLASVLRLIGDRQNASEMQTACAPVMSPDRASAILNWMLHNGIVVAAGS